ncbi:MAG: MarR family transcriptional regulator [bacterium]|nr:MarR family transcriptional regulator [bacterium]
MNQNKPDVRPMGELETLVMKEVWKRGRATVHDVRDALQQQRPMAYTTVLTTLRNLEKKGYLHHEAEGRMHVYIPVVDHQTAARASVHEVLQRFFDGSKARLANALFEEEPLTQKEFEALRREIMELRKREQSDG